MTFSTNNQVQVSVEDLMDTLNSVQAEEATKTRTGIAPRPDKEKSKDSDVLGFFRDMFANSQAKAVEAREAIQPEMYRLAKESAYEVSQARQMAGITRSLTEGGGEIGRKPLPEGTTLRPVAKPPMTTMRDVTGTDEGKLDNEQPLRDLASAVANEQISSEELEPVAKDEADEIVNTLVEQLTNTRITAGGATEEPAPVTAETETTEVATPSGGLMSPRSDTKGLTPITKTNKAQERLHKLGFVEVGAADGAAGPSTRSAVRRYQGENELPVTGRLDDATLASLTASSADLDKIMQRQITHHEGKKNYPYKDSLGKWTIGVGHLIGVEGSDKDLEDSGYSQYTRENPMPESEVSELFQEDLEEHKAIAEGYDFYDDMSEEGKRAILDLTFNMGDFYNKKKKNGKYMWPTLRSQIQAGDWEGAANNLASSTYGRQVGQRAITVTDLLRQAGG